MSFWRAFAVFSEKPNSLRNLFAVSFGFLNIMCENRSITVGLPLLRRIGPRESDLVKNGCVPNNSSSGDKYISLETVSSSSSSVSSSSKLFSSLLTFLFIAMASFAKASSGYRILYFMFFSTSLYDMV